MSQTLKGAADKNWIGASNVKFGAFNSAKVLFFVENSLFLFRRLLEEIRF